MEKNTLKNVHWLSDKSIAYLQVDLELYAGNYSAVLEQTEDLEAVYPETVLRWMVVRPTIRLK